MGGSSVPVESMDSMLQAYSKYLPGLLQDTSALAPTVAQNQLAATQATQPAYNRLNFEQTRDYALPLAELGQQVTESNAQAGARTNLNQLQGAGGDVARQAYQLARETNPNYYGVQDAASQQAQNMLNAIDLRGLSPGEQMAVERGLNQQNGATGNLGLNNSVNTVRNAMSFGDAYDKKIGQLGNALTAANQTATSAQNTGFSPVNLALGQPNASTMGNFGTGTFTNTTPQTQNASSANAFQFGSSLLGNMTSTNNAAQSANASMANANSPAALIGAVGSLNPCCFIFLEAYHGKLPKIIRKARNRCYNLEPDIATGYRRMACWLVPAMQESSLVRSLVWRFMVGPITDHLLYITKRGPRVRFAKPISRFWLRTWALLGKGHLEAEYNKPWMPQMLKEVK